MMSSTLIDNKESKRETFIVICMSIFCCLILCSCQSSPKIIAKVNLSSDIYSTSELSIYDENYQDVLNRCQQKLDTIPEDSLEAADAYKIMGGIYASYLEDKDTAISYINKAIQIDERENNEVGLARDYNEMSKVYIACGGDLMEGLQYIEKAEQIYEKFGMSDHSENAGTLVNKGRLYNLKGEQEKAIDYMMKAQEIYIRDPIGEDVPLCIEMGQIYVEMREYEKAKAEYLKAQKICEVKGYEYYLAIAKNQLGWLYKEQEDYVTAIDYYKQALEYFKKNNNFKKEALIYNNMASATYRQGLGAEKVIPISINANRVINKINPETIPIKNSKKNYKHNLGVYYKVWSNDTSEEGFEKWYQEVVLNGKDWKEVNVESKTTSN